MEHKSHDLTLELKGDDGGEFSAYFATFNDVDHGNDRIEPGAFKNLDEFVKSGWIGLNHEHARLPVAYPVSAIQDGKGLLVTGRYHSTAFAQDVRTVAKERMHAGKAVKGSIGYRVTDHEKIDLNGKSIRSLKGIDLAECSFVNLPMNPAAEFVSSKSLASIDEIKRQIDTWLDERKAGRVLSGANLAVLAGWDASVGDLHGQIRALRTEHDPALQLPFDIQKSASVDESADLYIQTLALCAKFGPFPPSPGKG